MTSPGPGGGDIVWRPSADIVENSTLTAFLRANRLADFEALLMNTGKLVEAAAAGVPDALKGETVICACVPKSDVVADEHLAAHLCDSVVKGLGAAFRPRQVFFVSDLPKTRNMKVMRRVVRALYEGKDPGDLAALVNPEAVAELRDRMAAIHGRT